MTGDMPDYIVQPFIGIGPVRFGMSRDDVRHAMPEQSQPFRKGTNGEHETDAFHQNGFQVFYTGATPTVEYIELSRDSGLRALYRDLDVFTTPVDEVAAFIARDATFDESYWEFPYSYIFRELQLILWRPVVPESDTDPDGRYFSTIGIGRRGYVDAPS
jgi:hypothetical protein